MGLGDIGLLGRNIGEKRREIYLERFKEIRERSGLDGGRDWRFSILFLIMDEQNFDVIDRLEDGDKQIVQDDTKEGNYTVLLWDNVELIVVILNIYAWLISIVKRYDSALFQEFKYTHFLLYNRLKLILVDL